MNHCPFCAARIFPTFANGLLRERCSKCNALWFEGESLENLVGTEAATALVEQTRGLPGKCKKCSTWIKGRDRCPKCKHPSPTCPQCGIAPLAVAVIEDMRVDVCSGCKGVAMDTESMTKLMQIVAERRPSRPSDKPKPEAKVLTKAPCVACDRKYLLKYTFIDDGKIYCGSCAPVGSAPFTEDIALANRTLAPALSNFLTGHEDLTDEAVAVGIGILFKLAASNLGR